MTVLVVLIVTTLFGRLAPIFFPGNSFDYDDVQENFFANNFHSAMSALSKLSYQVLGSNTKTVLAKIFLMLFLALLGAFAWYTIQVTGTKSYLDFLWRGMTVELGDDDRNYIIQHWPWIYLDFNRNSGKEIFVGDQYLQAVVLAITIFVALSASLCISMLNSIALIREFGRERFQVWQALLKMLFSACVGLIIDLLFLAAFLFLVILIGRAFDTSIEEMFDANVSNNVLEYGYTLSVGSYDLGETAVGIGIAVPGVDFSSLGINQGDGSSWVHWIFPEPAFVNDAGALCHRYTLGGLQCADHLRALYFERFSRMGYSANLVTQIVRHLATMGTSLACGQNLWSSIAGWKMQHQLITILLPLAAALAVVFVSRFFVMPWLALILLLDYAMVRLGRHVALLSETGLSIVSRHGPGLLAAPPVIATILLMLLAKSMC